jgi:Protein of unknown function (DUF1566)
MISGFMAHRAKSVFASCMLSALVLGPMTAHAKHPRGLNDTGATQCFVGGILVSDCVGTGQDAGEGRDIDFPRDDDGALGFSFAKVCNSGQRAGTGSCPLQAAWGTGLDQWGCTLDLVTGLMWELKTVDGSIRDRSRYFDNRGYNSPTDAEVYARQINRRGGLCGAADWRLPFRHESMQLIDYGASTGAFLYIDSNWFPDVLDGQHYKIYWTATKLPSTKYKWVVHYHLGSVSYQYMGYMNHVRLVSGSLAVPKTRRFVQEGGEVYDRTSRLVWRRCFEGQVWTGATCTGAPTFYRRDEALLHAQEEAARANLPWRVPSINELDTIVDDTRTSPATYEHAFPGVGPFPYDTWSSTPMMRPGQVGLLLMSFIDGRLRMSEEPDRTTAVWLRLARTRQGAELQRLPPAATSNVEEQ